MGFTDLMTGGPSGLLPRFMGTCGIISGCPQFGHHHASFRRDRWTHVDKNFGYIAWLPASGWIDTYSHPTCFNQ